MRSFLHLLVFALMTIPVLGQDDGWNPISQDNVFTPRGSSITAYLMNENSDYIRQYYDQVYSGPNRTLLHYFPGQPSSTALFNCHGYAWHIYEGGSPHFIGLYNTTDEDSYMTDGSYIKICGPAYPGKISWGNGDHSAVTTPTPNRWVSKWNRFVYVEHDPTDTPYNTDQTIYNYYANASIKSSDTYNVSCSSVGVDQTFSVGYTTVFQLLTGFHCTWSIDGDLQQVSNNNTDNSFTVRGTSLPGVGTVRATITSDCDTRTIVSTKKIYFGAGSVGGTYSYGGNIYQVSGSTGITVNNSANTVYFDLTNPWDSDPNTTYTWSINSRSGSFSYSLPGKTGQITLGGGASANITCTTHTPCGDISATFNCYNTSGSYRMAVYPNPANQNMTVATVRNDDSNSAENQSMSVDQPVQDNDLTDINAIVRLVDKDNIVLKEGKLIKGKLSLPVDVVPDGIYYLQLNFDDQQIRKQIVIHH